MCDICQIDISSFSVHSDQDVIPEHGNYYVCKNWNKNYIMCEEHINTSWWVKHYQNGILVRKKVCNRVYDCNPPKKIIVSRKKVGNRVYEQELKKPPTNIRKVGNRLYDSSYYD